jgi:hypothetical protein
LDTWRGSQPENGASVMAASVSGDGSQLGAAGQPALPPRTFLPYAAREAVALTISIPIVPQGWTLALTEPRNAASPLAIGGGLRFLGSHTRTDKEFAYTTLFWQRNGETDGPISAGWQLAMSVTDSDNVETTCRPLLVEPPYPLLQPDQLFFSEAAMPLPATRGPWRLVLAPGSCAAHAPIVVPPG